MQVCYTEKTTCMFKQCQKTVTLVLISGGYNELVRPIKTQNISRVPAFQQHVEATGCPPIGSTRWHPCREKGGGLRFLPLLRFLLRFYQRHYKKDLVVVCLLPWPARLSFNREHTYQHISPELREFLFSAPLH